jgi:DNA replication protein DnaC
MLELALGLPHPPREVIAFGNRGTGKAHVALGFGLAACQKGLRSISPTTALVNELHEPYDERCLLRLQCQVAGYKSHIIDEPGYARSQSVVCASNCRGRQT